MQRTRKASPAQHGARRRARFLASRRQWRCSRRPRSTIASIIPSAAATMSSSSTASSTTDNKPSDRGRPRRRLLSADVPQASAAENGGEVSVAKGVGALPCVDTGPPNTAASIRLAKKWLAGHPVPPQCSVMHAEARAAAIEAAAADLAAARKSLKIVRDALEARKQPQRGSYAGLTTSELASSSWLTMPLIPIFAMVLIALLIFFHFRRRRRPPLERSSSV